MDTKPFKARYRINLPNDGVCDTDNLPWLIGMACCLLMDPPKDTVLGNEIFILDRDRKCDLVVSPGSRDPRSGGRSAVVREKPIDRTKDPQNEQEIADGGWMVTSEVLEKYPWMTTTLLQSARMLGKIRVAPDPRKSRRWLYHRVDAETHCMAKKPW